MALVLLLGGAVEVQDVSAQQRVIERPQTRTLKRVPKQEVNTAKTQVISKANSKKKSKKERRRARSQKASLKHLNSLEPEFRAKVARVLEALRQKGWDPVIISGRRDAEQQRKIVAAGRSGTMKSYHLCGRAADIADAHYGWRGEARSPSFPFWDALGEAARAEGLVWGGDWKKRDIPHIQSRTRCP